MSDLVLGIGASHTTLMNTQWDKVDHLPRAHQFRDALAQARKELTQVDPDLVVIIGSNHFRGQWLDLMPSFLVGVDEITGSGEHGTPGGLLKSNPGAAQYLCNELVEQGFDISFSTRLVVDHGITHAVQYLLPEDYPPIVPIVINSFAPPLPTLSRVQQFGEALEGILQTVPNVNEIAVIGTGGLSHSLPFPDWRSPQTEDDRFLAESWHEGRGRWEEFEGRRRNIIVNAPPVIREEFDSDVLNALEHGCLHTYLSQFSNEDLSELAGNGGNEIRAWLAMAACMGYAPSETLAYSAMPEWLTGMAVATIST